MKQHAVQEIERIIESVLSLNLKPICLVISTFGGFTIGAATGFANDWIFDPAISFFFLLGLICADHLSGMYLAWKNDRWETRKATRIFWTLLSHTALLSFASNLAKGSEALYWLDEGIFVPLVIVNLISLIKNLSLLGLIKKDFSKLFYKKIDAYKNEFIESKPKSDHPPSRRTPDDGC